MKPMGSRTDRRPRWSPNRITRAARLMWRRSVSRAVSLQYRSALLSSGLFDTEFYAAQVGMKPDRDRCVRHYLQQGGAGGFSPNRLFDGTAYLAAHPDVAAAQMDPFFHFVVFGIAEGRRNRVPESCLAHVESMTHERLAERRVSQQALALGWNRDRPSVWTGKTVGVYASSLGNFFFRHIADRIADGLRSSAVRVYRLDQNSVRPSDAVADLFVAPHEFFHLGSGPRWRDVPEVVGSIMLNTEQPGTTWYFLALRSAGCSTTLIDLSPQSALLLRDLGWPRSGYFPVGSVSSRLTPWNKPSGDMAKVRGLEVQAAARAKWFSSTSHEWRDRPIDVLFLGTLTPRRSEALARLAPTLARYKCFIHAPTGLGRPLTGGRSTIGMEESLHLARNAKVLLNIHRDEFSYFEWHRVMMIGIEQGAVVLSEPCFPFPGVEPGQHFLEAPIDQMPASLSQLVGSADGELLARQIDGLRADELRERFDLRNELSALAFLHSTGFPRHA
jgi:hypothetical protein